MHALCKTDENPLIRKGAKLMDNITVKYSKDSECIECEIIGEFPKSDVEIDKYYKTISDLCSEHEAHNIIVDYRRLLYSQLPSQMIKGPERLKIYKLDFEYFKFAFIMDKSSESYREVKLALAEIDTKRFLGALKARYRIFENKEEALLWLRGS